MKKERVGQMVEPKEENTTDEILETLVGTLGCKVYAKIEIIRQHRNIDFVQEIVYILDEFKIPVELNGYKYLKEAIKYCITNEVESVTGELYPEIAKKFKTTSSKVERGIRNAIQTAWCEGDVEILKKYFGKTICFRDHLTNSEFIFVIVDYFKMKMNFVEIIVKDAFKRERKFNLTQEITKIFQELGLLAQVKGYDYLKEAIEYCMTNKVESVTGELYPQIAKKFKTTSSTVDSRIRYVIEFACNRGDFTAFEKYFSYTINCEKGKPTNSQFIFMIIDYLKIRLNLVESIKENKTCEEKEKNLMDEITQIIHEIGIPANLKGYNYLRAAIEYGITDEVIFTYGQLYRQIARKFGATSSSVERAMRNAIEVAWDRGNVDSFEKYIGNTIVLKKGKPSNSEFIFMIVDYIKNNFEN